MFFNVQPRIQNTFFAQPLTLPLSNELMDTGFVNCSSVLEALPTRRTKLAGDGQCTITCVLLFSPPNRQSRFAAGATRPKLRAHTGPLSRRRTDIPQGTERCGAAPAETLDLHHGSRQSPEPREPPTRPSPARSPTQPSLVRLLVQRLHDAGRAGLRLPRNTSSQPHFRLPTSGLRTRPPE